MTARIFGHVPGVPVGATFPDRKALSGLRCPPPTAGRYLGHARGRGGLDRRVGRLRGRRRLRRHHRLHGARWKRPRHQAADRRPVVQARQRCLAQSVVVRVKVPERDHAARPVPEDPPDRGDVRPGRRQERRRRVAELVPAAVGDPGPVHEAVERVVEGRVVVGDPAGRPARSRWRWRSRTSLRGAEIGSRSRVPVLCRGRAISPASRSTSFQVIARRSARERPANSASATGTSR